MLINHGALKAAAASAAAAAAALGGNLGGITSWLFSLDGGQLAASTRADIIVPVKGFKRCYDAGYGFGEPLSAWLKSDGSVQQPEPGSWHCVLFHVLMFQPALHEEPNLQDTRQLHCPDHVIQTYTHGTTNAQAACIRSCVCMALHGCAWSSQRGTDLPCAAAHPGLQSSNTQPLGSQTRRCTSEQHSGQRQHGHLTRRLSGSPEGGR
jgi:hypothetical protein